MKIIDEDLLDEFRNANRCEGCGEVLLFTSEPHHVFTRGMGGGGRLDVRQNIIALGGPGDCNCHNKHHAGHEPTTAKLKDKVAEREGITVEELEAEIHRLRRLPKGAKP